MARLLSLVITAIITSLYFFPFSFVGLPFFNTKLIAALCGVILYAYQASRYRLGKFPHKFTVLTIYALIFSLVCFLSVVINNTTDFAYASYFISMWVWLSGAYFVCHCIKKIEGNLSLNTLTNILILVCILQCIAALVIDNNTAVKSWVDAHIEQGQEFLNKVKRLYGIGANLDVAGSRFSIVLVLIANILSENLKKLKKYQIPLYLASFVFIAIVGNMIARTTSVGVILGIVYIIIQRTADRRSDKPKSNIFWWTCFILLMAIPISVVLYNSSPETKKLFRFAFEGFFSLWEKGEWSVASNDTLQTMVVFPETFKTWLIGDGYFSNPLNTDPFFIGEIIGGYYMGTDIGYLRFIFYCGMSGLIAFSLFIIRSALFCIQDFPKCKLLFTFILVVNFIVWIKVSTDIFLAFALILMIKTVNDNQDHPDDLPDEITNEEEPMPHSSLNY